MLTAAILSPHYFLFGSGATEKRPDEMAFADLSSPRRLSERRDSAYRLFYCCLPLYDRVKVTECLELTLMGLALGLSGKYDSPISSVHPGMKLLKHLVDTGVAEFDPSLDGIMRGLTGKATDAKHRMSAGSS